MNRDILNQTGRNESLRPAVYAASASGETVDLQGTGSAMVVVSVGATVGAEDYSIELQESDASGSGFTAVAAGDLIGTEPTALEADTVYSFGYRGSKRYILVRIVAGAGTSAATCGVVITGELAQSPSGFSVAS